MDLITLARAGDPFPGSAFDAPCHRIPALAVTASGRVLAAWDVRAASGKDGIEKRIYESFEKSLKLMRGWSTISDGANYAAKYLYYKSPAPSGTDQ